MTHTLRLAVCGAVESFGIVIARRMFSSRSFTVRLNGRRFVGFLLGWRLSRGRMLFLAALLFALASDAQVLAAFEP